ncbi:LysE family translocator [Patulibacter americanus]|uniref:LysE family translocator n=1 Tax=Patulibacter americanus TaxID=588672 RepID=UPI0003B750B6|nr:LysE family translocator [Patulibacter americanus]
MGIDWLTFVGVVLGAYVIPGPDFAIILRAATRGRRPGIAAALGAQTGLCLHVAIATVGLSLVLARSADALTVIRLAGAAYLCWLGARMVWSTRHGGPIEREAATPRADDEPLVLRAVFVQAFTTNVLNPKAILFFASVLPQFVQPSGSATLQILALGVVDVLLGIVVWAGLVLVGVRLASQLRRPAVRRVWDRVTGGVLMALGGTIATSKA